MIFFCSYEEYIPVKKRRALQQQARLVLLNKVYAVRV